MQRQDIIFQMTDDGCRICAICHNKQIGSIFFVKIGTDKIMISEAEIEPDYKDENVELYLIEEIIGIARQQHRKVMSICPYISNIFKQHPEFDDVRMINQGR